jgi:transposase
MGRSRGGLTTKIHALTDANGLPLELILTPGQAGDCPAAEGLLGRLRRDTIVLADKAYDADWLRRRIEAAGAAPKHPLDGGSPVEGLLQPGALPCAQPHRALLQPHQTLPAHRHALRKARRKLPRHAQTRRNPTLGAP